MTAATHAVIVARIARGPRRNIGIVMFAAVLAAILALTWFAYHPGLSGAFLFDDLGSLPKLGATGPVDNWAAFWRYITSGSADPTGRPLTLLTFLIDGNNWPTSPYPFKVTNVILHLINGALLAWVLWWLGKVLCSSASGDAFPSLPLERGAEQSERARSAPEVDGSLPTADTPPALRADPHRSERGKTPGAYAASPPPSAERGIEGNAVFVSGSRTAAFAALFGAGAWLLHPLLVSTTLYIVQREAMLPATFVLMAILGWIASREALAHGHIKRGLAGMTASAWICTTLAVLSKANGALLPLLLLLVEWIVLAPRRPMPDQKAHAWLRRSVVVLLIVPGALVITYLLYLLPGSLAAPVGARGWSMAQRLLTEPRVLTDYLRLLFIPHAYSSGLFNDAFPVSTNWLQPWQTIPCIALILALIVAGFALRKKHPAIALALLFYFTAQLMESGWIPLELYFEHRNYLPAVLLFWPIGIGLTRCGPLRWLGIVVGAGVLVALAMLTFQRATLWGNAPRQAQVWAAINPGSARAQTSAALYDLQNNRPRLAAARLRLAMRIHPDDLQIPVNLITAECRLGAVQSGTLTAARTALAKDRVGGTVAFNWFGQALGLVNEQACHGLDYASLQRLLDAAWHNPYWRAYAGLRANLYHLQGALALVQHKPRDALQEFNRALAQKPEPGTALAQAATLGVAGYPMLGMSHLDYFETLQVPAKTGFNMSRVHAWVLHKQDWWTKETAHMREVLVTDAAGTSRHAVL